MKDKGRPLSKKQRNLFADKMMDLGNLAVAGLIFSQLVTHTAISLTLTGVGGILISILYLGAYLVTS